MDPLDFLDSKDLLRFFHFRKTELSCMENPHTFLNQLRDYSLIPEDRYKKVIRMKSRENLKKSVYEILDWMETHRCKYIHTFWKCVFMDVMLSQYPTLKHLRNCLMDASPLKKGQKEDIWTWPIYASQLPVECGNLEGTLERRRLAEGQKCIRVQRQWLTPSQFEKAAGKQNAKNWKLSIRCRGTPLGKLLQDGHLESGSYKRRSKKAKTLLFAPEHLSTDEDEEGEEEQTKSRKVVFRVSCGAAAGTLHQNRFASGSRGKSIRTETAWLSPEEFTVEALGRSDVSWKRDIECEGKALSALIEEDVLKVHEDACPCPLCRPSPSDLENQRNDDECCICRSQEEEEDEEEEEEEQLVVCDDCPRSFHQKCHLPHVEDVLLREETKWFCTFCVYRTNQAWFKELDGSVMSRQISEHMLQCQYLLLFLSCADEEQDFATNPILYLEDYSTFVQTPMWLGKIADKLQRKQYQTVGQFVSDVRLIFTNCASYNQNNDEFLAKGGRLKTLFDREFEKVFKVCDVTSDKAE